MRYMRYDNILITSLHNLLIFLRLSISPMRCTLRYKTFLNYSIVLLYDILDKGNRNDYNQSSYNYCVYLLYPNDTYERLCNLVAVFEARLRRKKNEGDGAF